MHFTRELLSPDTEAGGGTRGRPAVETQPASESNAELEGARTPGSGPRHGRETPGDLGVPDEELNEAMAPVPDARRLPAEEDAASATERDARQR